MTAGLEVNAEKTKYECMFMSRHQNAGKSHSRNTANRSFKNVANLKYIGTTMRDQNLIREEIKSRKIPVVLATIQFRNFVFSSVV
jgi:hypothetical protein